jgi:hypothetical protein
MIRLTRSFFLLAATRPGSSRFLLARKKSCKSVLRLMERTNDGKVQVRFDLECPRFEIVSSS